MDATIKNARSRGDRLLFEVNSNLNANTNASQWTSFRELAGNGWKFVGANKEFPNLDEFELPEFFSRFNAVPDRNKSLDWEHPKNGVAKYCAIYNVHEGIIFSTDRVSPQAALDGKNIDTVQPPPEPKPELEHWSDVAYLQWEKLCLDEVQSITGLKRVVFCNIINEATAELINAVYGSGSKSYPGKIYTPDDDTFKVLLGTANAQGVAHLLSQHKSVTQLGRKEFKELQVFQGGLTNNWYMVFEFR